MALKQRAVKCGDSGVTLPPTPSAAGPGVREAIKNGSVDEKKLARKKLQRHQKACHQVVVRGEQKQQMVPGFCEIEVEYERDGYRWKRQVQAGSSLPYERAHAMHAFHQECYRERVAKRPRSGT